MLAPVKHILPLTSIRRERVLPILGKVVARRMQKVAPMDVVAEANLAAEHVMIDLTQGLNVSAARADELLQRQSGDTLSKGDVIAGPIGIFQRVVRAPFDCEVKIAADGKVLLEKETPPYQLLAGMEGTVTNIIPDRGVIIETRGALIQGVWGNGSIAHGVMQPLSQDLNQEVKSEQIDISFRGAIAFGGFCKDPNFFSTAASIPIKGLILGSMSSALVPLAQEMDFPVILVDGFGKRPMNSAAWKLLISNEEKELSLNAQEYNPTMGDFPEIIISSPTPDEVDAPQETGEYAVGNKVYVDTGPYASRTGVIENLHEKTYTFPNGLQTSAAQVNLSRNERVWIPLKNLEILET